MLWALAYPDLAKSLLDRFGWPCYLRQFTGIECVGCGGTRAVRACLRGDWLEALWQNFMLLPSLLVLLQELVQSWLAHWGLGGRETTWGRVRRLNLRCYFIAIICFWIGRNFVD